MFEELCKLKEASGYCPAPPKDLKILDYQQLVRPFNPKAAIGDDEDDDSDVAPEDWENDYKDEDSGSELDFDSEDIAEELEEDDEPDDEEIPLRNSQERMQESLDGMIAQDEEEAFLEDPVAMMCVVFMRQSFQDDHEPSFGFVADHFAEFYQRSERVPHLRDEMLKDLEKMKVGIKHMV